MVNWFEIIGLIGATLIITSGYIFDELRSFVAKVNRHLGIFVACSMCIGFWIGFAYSFSKDFSFIEKVLFGCFISLLSYVTDTVIIFIERVSNVLLQKAANNSSKKHDE